MREMAPIGEMAPVRKKIQDIVIFKKRSHPVPSRMITVVDDDENALVAIVDVERDEAVVAAEVLVGEGDDVGCRYYL